MISIKDEIKEILLKDFNEILVKEFCTDWKEKRLYIELLVNSTPFSNLLDYITNLQEENEELLKKSYSDDVRITKAIEYIENNKQLSMFADLRKEGTHQYDLECDADDLLEILKGKSDE